MINPLNRAATKKFVLTRFKDLRSGDPMTRVSKKYLDNLEARLKNMIITDIQGHRSVGVTFDP